MERKMRKGFMAKIDCMNDGWVVINLKTCYFSRSYF